MRKLGTPDAVAIAREKARVYMIEYNKARKEKKQKMITKAQKRIELRDIYETYVEQLNDAQKLIGGCKDLRFRSSRYEGGIGYAA